MKVIKNGHTRKRRDRGHKSFAERHEKEKEITNEYNGTMC